jgi:hypothetical protein
MRAWLLMLAIFCAKNYIPAAKKNCTEKRDLTELAERRFAIRQAGQRLDLQPDTMKNKSARQKRIAEQRKQKDEFNTEPNCIRNTTLDLIIGMDI